VVAPNRAALYTERKGECRWSHVEWDAERCDGVAPGWRMTKGFAGH